MGAILCHVDPKAYGIGTNILRFLEELINLGNEAAYAWYATQTFMWKQGSCPMEGVTVPRKS